MKLIDRIEQGLRLSEKLNEKDAEKTKSIISKIQNKIQDNQSKKAELDEDTLNQLVKLNAIHNILLNKIDEGFEIQILENLIAE